MYTDTINSLEDLTVCDTPSPTVGLTAALQQIPVSSQTSVANENNGDVNELRSGFDEAVVVTKVKRSFKDAWMSQFSYKERRCFYTNETKIHGQKNSLCIHCKQPACQGSVLYQKCLLNLR